MANDVGDEGVAVGPRPSAVSFGISVARDQFADAGNRPLGGRAPDRLDELGTSSVPIAIRKVLAIHDDAFTPAEIPTDDLVDAIRGRVPLLRGDPGVHREVFAPAKGPRGVNLHDGLALDGR